MVVVMVQYRLSFAKAIGISIGFVLAMLAGCVVVGPLFNLGLSQ